LKQPRHYTALVVAILAWAVLTMNAQDSAAGYFANWFPRVTKTQAEQPHWITPLFTTTPRLEEEFRADITWTPTPAAGKGLELIPTEHTEIILGLPPYQVPAKGPAGFSNVPLTLKFRSSLDQVDRSNDYPRVAASQRRSACLHEKMPALKSPGRYGQGRFRWMKTN
jgi:hypothetical protein